MTDSRWWRDFDAVVAASLPAASRVLDVGCGDGGLVTRLAGLGFDAFGVDPAAPAHPRLIRGQVQHVTHLGPFDGVTAVMSLHHADLDSVVAALTRLLRPHGTLIVHDFDWAAYDHRAASWVAAHDSSGANNTVPAWRDEHSDLHTSATVTRALSTHFEPVHEVPRPYLARMLGRPELEAAERSLIDAQMLPALGYWLTAISRPGPRSPSARE